MDQAQPIPASVPALHLCVKITMPQRYRGVNSTEVPEFARSARLRGSILTIPFVKMNRTP
jgi:hypothetical protein